MNSMKIMMMMMMMMMMMIIIIIIIIIIIVIIVIIIVIIFVSRVRSVMFQSPVLPQRRRLTTAVVLNRRAQLRAANSTWEVAPPRRTRPPWSLPPTNGGTCDPRRIWPPILRLIRFTMCWPPDLRPTDRVATACCGRAKPARRRT